MRWLDERCQPISVQYQSSAWFFRHFLLSFSFLLRSETAAHNSEALETKERERERERERDKCHFERCYSFLCTLHLIGGSTYSTQHSTAQHSGIKKFRKNDRDKKNLTCGKSCGIFDNPYSKFRSALINYKLHPFVFFALHI